MTKTYKIIIIRVKKMKDQQSRNSPLSDCFQLGWVVDKNLNSKFHFHLVETEVQTCYLCANNLLCHCYTFSH